MPVASLEEIASQLGSAIGTSPWIEIDQRRIDAFAEVTGDHQFIHVDPAAAAATPFGGTIAHGFLTLSLLSQMAASVMLVPAQSRMVVNYGFDKIRFTAAVPAGSRVRGHFTLVGLEQRKPGQWQIVHHVSVEIDGVDKPALQAEWIGSILV